MAASKSSGKESASKRHANLPEMRPRLHVAQCGVELGEGEAAVDHRMEAVRDDGAVHRLEHLLGADADAVKPGTLHDDGHGIEGGALARKHADDGNEAARTEGAERALKRAGAADLDDAVRTQALGELEHALVPRGARAVVDRGIGAERLEVPAALVAARGRDHAAAPQLGEL